MNFFKKGAPLYGGVVKNAHEFKVTHMVIFFLSHLLVFPSLVTERITTSDGINLLSSEGTQLLDQAITDLEIAANLLPSSWER